MEIKKVSLIGAGAMGMFFAPRLYRVLGKNFRLIADGARKERLETRGLRVNGETWHFQVCTPAESDPADLIIIAVKDTGLSQALLDIRGQVGENTVILPILNGISAEEKAAAVYGWEHLLYGYMRISICMKDGVCDFDPDGGAVYFGEKENPEKGRCSERVEAVKALFDRCGIPYKNPADMLQGKWFKFMANIGENMTCALLGVPFGAFRTSDHANFIRRAAMREVVAIAQKKGIALGQEQLDIQEKVVVKIPAANKPSTLQDLEAGRKTEIEMFSGTVVRMGKELGIPTPVNEVLYHGICAIEERLGIK